MDMRRIVVVVEEEEAARTAFEWALHNLLRYGDLITLLHVFPTTTKRASSTSKSKSKSKIRLSRLKGFQLALSFKDICSHFPNTKMEIVVTEGDQEGHRIVALVREIGAAALVVGLHDRSFLYKLGMGHSNIASSLNCRVLAIKSNASSSSPDTSSSSIPDSSTNMDFSQIDIAGLHVLDPPEPKIRYRICPSPSAIIWRSRSNLMIKRRPKSSSTRASRDEAQFRLIRGS